MTDYKILCYKADIIRYVYAFSGTEDCCNKMKAYYRRYYDRVVCVPQDQANKLIDENHEYYKRISREAAMYD